MTQDPCAVLGVARDASGAEIAEAYRTLAQIYHPDRYAEAPTRVQAEANARMQALNAAFAAVKVAPPPPQTGEAVRSSPPPPPPATATVHYVDGAEEFHAGGVAPLGYAGGEEAVGKAVASRCSRLDEQLLAWLELQRRGASAVTQQLYASWTEEERRRYAARMGCTRTAPAKVRAFGRPCSECHP